MMTTLTIPVSTSPSTSTRDLTRTIFQELVEACEMDVEMLEYHKIDEMSDSPHLTERAATERVQAILRVTAEAIRAELTHSRATLPF